MPCLYARARSTASGRHRLLIVIPDMTVKILCWNMTVPTCCKPAIRMGPGIDEPIAVTKAGSTFYYHQDGLGTVTELAGIKVKPCRGICPSCKRASVDLCDLDED